MTSLLSETQRRKLFRVALLYVLTAWVVLQVAALAFPGLDIPDSAIRYVWLAVILGFPLALLAGWFYNISSKGILRSSVDDDGVAVDLPLGRLDYLILGILFVVSAGILYSLSYQIVQTRPGGTSGVEPEQTVSASIGVLPFVYSGDQQQNAYLADGLSEDILNRLARTAELHVASRSSSFNLSSDVDLETAAGLLNVEYILAGSIARSGEVIRVSARLIRAGLVEPLWSRIYEKEWTDILEIQNDIGSAVTARLGVTDDSHPVRGHVPDREAYDLFLRARFVAQARTPRTLARSEGLIRQALVIDPLFAEAHGFLSSLYFYQKAYVTSSKEEHARLFDLAEKTAVQALLLDEDLPTARAILGAGALYRHEWQLAEENFRRALSVAPNDSQVKRWYSRQLMWLGYLEEALYQAQAAQRLDPINPASNGNLGLAFALLGKSAQATEFAAIARELGLEYFYTPDILVNLAEGRQDAAATAWKAGLAASGQETDIIDAVMSASNDSGLIKPTMMQLEQLLPVAGPALEWTLAVLFLRQYELFLDQVAEDGFMDLWIPLAQPARQSASFREVVTNSGMLDYWELRGWPDLCHPEDDGFKCD